MSTSTKKKPITYITHKQYAIVNESGYPMNPWGIFTNPTGSIMLFHREDLAEKEMSSLQGRYPRSELQRARVIECHVTWPKDDDE